MFVFVILHYKNLDDTLECIDSIKKIPNEKKIVVVDNNSLSEDEKKNIEEKVDDLLILNDNLGFAKANNKGIELAYNKYKPSFVIAINNDIIIDDLDFLNKIRNDYEEYEFDLLGPKIITEGDSCNPFPVLKTKEQVQNEIKYCNKLVKIYSSSLLYLLLKMYLGVKYSILKPHKAINGGKIQKNVALHGCAIIFSKKYLKKYDTAFYNDTFLYHEEEFLYQRIIKDKLISVYDPNISLFHKEGSSLNNVINKERKRKLFKEKERIKSLNKLLKTME